MAYQQNWQQTSLKNFIKVVATGILGIGASNGVVQLFDVHSRKIIFESAQQDKGFVRDLLLFQDHEFSYLAILLVQIKAKNRKYTLVEFLLKHSSETGNNFQLIEDDQRKTVLFEHNYKLQQEKFGEFQWWEAFKPLQNSHFAFQFNDLQNNLFIVDMEETCKQSAFQDFKFIPIKTADLLNWVFVLPQTIDQKQSKTKTLIIVNNSMLELREVQLPSFELKQSKYVENIPKDWKPNDVMLLETEVLLVASVKGFIKFDLHSRLTEQIAKSQEVLNNEDNNRIARSFDKRIVATSGRSRDLYLYEARTMKQISKLFSGQTCDLRMTSEHVFLKSAEKAIKGWYVFSLKETKQVKTIKGLQIVHSKLKDILFDITEKGYQTCVGIVCDQTEWINKQPLASYQSFRGQVRAVNVKTLNSDFDIELMSSDESELGNCVLNIVLHQDKLTWLVCNEEQQQISIRQAELSHYHYVLKICRNLKFGKTPSDNGVDLVLAPMKKDSLENKKPIYLFGGFYLSVSKDNATAVLTFADSRDADLAHTKEKWYLEIDFESVQINVLDQKKMDGDIKINTIFTLNDGQAKLCTTKEGKHLKIGSQQFAQQFKTKRDLKINAKNLRLSPDMMHVVFENPQKEYFVAETCEKNDCKQEETEHKYKFSCLKGIYPLQKSDDMQDLATLRFFSNEYFGIGKLKKSSEFEIEEYTIYRVSNGSLLCTFELHGEFQLVKNNTAPNVHAPDVQGIWDKQTNKVYPISLVNLIHLGAKQVVLGSPNKTMEFKKEIIEGFNNQKGEYFVLGLHAPGLYFENLKKLYNQQDQLRKVKRIKSKIFDYSVLRLDDSQKGTEIRLENVFQSICKWNYFQAIEVWLRPECNYYAYTSPSALSMIKVTLVKSVYQWIAQAQNDEFKQQIFSTLGHEEIIAVLNLPGEWPNKILELGVLRISNKIVNQRSLVKHAYATIENIQDLKQSDQLEKISESMSFEDKSKQQQMPYELNVCLLRFQCQPGSKNSRDFLQFLAKAGECNPLIYENQIIQQYLNFKFQSTKNIRRGRFLAYIIFLATINILPLLAYNQHVENLQFLLMAMYEVFFILNEALQFFSLFAMGFWTDYFDPWNILDWSIIVCQFLTLLTFYSADQITLSSISFSVLILAAWLNLLQYLRLFKRFRFLVNLVTKVFNSTEVINFILVMLVMCSGVSFGNFFYNHVIYEKSMVSGQFIENMPITLKHHFGIIFSSSFGELDFDETHSTYQEILFAFAVVMLALIMMNLLIGILSERLAQVLENKEQNDYAEMNSIVVHLETLNLMQFFYKGHQKHPRKRSWCSRRFPRFYQSINKPQHLIYVQNNHEKMDEGSEWKGRIKQTVNPILEELRKNDFKIDLKVNQITETQTSIQDTVQKQNSQLKEQIIENKRRIEELQAAMQTGFNQVINEIKNNNEKQRQFLGPNDQLKRTKSERKPIRKGSRVFKRSAEYKISEDLSNTTMF